MRSIRQQLLIGLFWLGLGSSTVMGLALYKSLREEANELSDQQLRQIAAGLPPVLNAASDRPAEGDPEEPFCLQAWDQQGRLLYASPAARALPRAAGDGFSAVRVDGHGWRLFGAHQAGRFVQVSQPRSVREALAGRMVLHVMLPLTIFIPILGILIYLIVGRALRPLERMAQAVAGRSPHALQPLELDGLSPDVRPVLVALNGLLAKIEQAMVAQRDFVADAAHELRSPLTALKLQLQLAERAGGDAARAAAFAKLHERLDRASHLVRQLLTLARHEPGPAAPRFSAVDLHQLAQRAVADHSTYADSKTIDLGVEARSASVMIEGDAEGLGVLLNNLVDNALRYTQQGGQVDVLAGVVRGRAILQVRDNGPGVPVPARGRLFDRFYRPDGNVVWGCGLGMAIVKNVADAHKAEIALGEGEAGVGFRITVSFPAGPCIA